MESITFVTDAGTKIKISNFEYAEVLDVMQAVVVGVNNLEEILANPTDEVNVDDGVVISAGLLMGGGVSIAIPPTDFEDEAEDEDKDSEEASLLQGQTQVADVLYTITSPEVRNVLTMGGSNIADDQSNVKDGYYRCGDCGDVHNIREVLEINAEMAA